MVQIPFLRVVFDCFIIRLRGSVVASWSDTGKSAFRDEQFIKLGLVRVCKGGGRG